MKKLATLLFFLLVQIANFAFGQTTLISDVQNNNLKPRKTRYYRIPGQGILIQLRYKSGENFFFMVNDRESREGDFINEDYPINQRRLKMTSAGPMFFVLRRSKHAPEKYQYSFDTKSWSYDKIPSSSWRVGDREGP